MALVASLEKAITLRKEEQARLQSYILRHRETLLAIAPQPKTAPDESAPDRPADADASPRETEDLKLLERALEKALRVRTGGALSKNRNKPGEEPTAGGVAPSNEVKREPAGVKGNQTNTKSTWKPSARGQRAQRQSSASSGHNHGRRKSTLNEKNCPDVSVAQQVPLKVDASCTDVSTAQQMGISADQAAEWKLLKNKQNRLWDKVAAAQRTAVPGRTRFIERMSAAFPEERPRGCPDPIRAPVGRMTHPGNQTKTLLDRHSPPGATEPEWEAWDRWRPEGGCPHSNLDERDGVNAPLPLTIRYRTKAELTELERLRMTVALLQQDLSLQQALLDALPAQLIVPGCSDPAVLRDLYSLLGEGGQRFPAIVLDCD